MCFSALLHCSPRFLWYSLLFLAISVWSVLTSVSSILLHLSLLLSQLFHYLSFPVFSIYFHLSPYLTRLLSVFYIMIRPQWVRIPFWSIYISVSATILFSVVSRMLLFFLSYDFCYPFELWSVFLLFRPVYESGKLCNYSLACNKTKPPVTWPSTCP